VYDKVALSMRKVLFEPESWLYVWKTTETGKFP
jgi:hypothetical protein